MRRLGSAAGRVIMASSVISSLAPVPSAGQGGETPIPDVAHRWDLGHRAAHFDLPGRLQEISGLAFSSDGQLFAHGDEVGVVYRIDPASGQVDHGFTLGPRPVKGDFEGIAAAGGRFFLVTSRGLLYEFREAAAGASSPYRVTNTGLGDHCEIEGLAYDSRTESLLFACKTLAPPARQIRIHRLPLDPTRPTPPPLVVPFSELAPFRFGEGIHPSGLEVDPQTGDLIVVAARERALVFLDRRGHVLAAVPLSSDHHRQPEGVAVGPNGSLYVSDEGAGHHAKLTVYAPLRSNP
jgi:uncharacterized protein YjiK